MPDLIDAAWARLCWALVRVGYAIRPYDMLADRRRWFWQPRTPCGLDALLGIDHRRRGDQPD